MSERQVFAVQVERHFRDEMLVEAADYREAEAHAQELMLELSATEFGDVENEVMAYREPVTVKPGEVVWRGGESGGWETEPALTQENPDEDVAVEECRSCGAPVMWLTHERTGRAAPIDASPVEGGNIVIDSTRRTYLIATEPGVVQGTLARRWMNHFATCPQGPSWRKKREPS